MSEPIDYESDALKTKVFPNDIERGEKCGLKWDLSIRNEQGPTGLSKITFVWKFDWEELRHRHKILGWKGTLMAYLWNKERYIWTGPHEFDVQFFGSEFTVYKGLERSIDQCYSTDGHFWFKHGFELEPIFKKRIVLIVEGREIKINKKILIKNSTYFAELLNSEKTEFFIENVDYDDMKDLLDMFRSVPVVPEMNAFPKLLELADVFKLPSVRLFAEFHLLVTDEIPLNEMIELADKFKMEQLFQQCINSLKSIDDVKKLVDSFKFTEGVKSKLFDRMMAFS